MTPADQIISAPAARERGTTRRAEKLNHVAIEICEDAWSAECRPKLLAFSGVWEPGHWKKPNIWRLDAAIHFRMPCWHMARGEHGDAVMVTGWREAPYVEWVEHWVYAKDRATAIACLVRDLNRDPRAEFISHAAVYRVRPPLAAGDVQRIEAINARLLRERAERAGSDERRVTHRQLAFG